MTTGPPDDPHPPDGKVLRLLTAVKGLTITNAIVIIMLVVVAIPSYVVWRALNDEKVMDKLLSSFDQLHTDTSCILNKFNLRGGPETYAIGTGFAYQGRDRWVVSVALDHPPGADELRSYCETLNIFVDHLRDPAARSPTFPNSDKPLIQSYDNPENDASFGGPR